MPKNTLTKEELKVRVLQLKNRLEKEYADPCSKNLAENYLNEVLFIIEQYSR